MKSKKTKIIIIIVCCLVLVIAAVCISLYNAMKLPYSKAVISGNAVDNDQNNSGDLIRIGDKLYYNYEKSKYCYGLIEISESGSKRIEWSGPHWLAYNVLLPDIYQKDGKLLTVFANAVQSYSSETESFGKDEFLDAIPGFRMGDKIDFREIGGKLFYKTDDFYKSNDLESTVDQIWLYENGEHKLLAEGVDLKFYVKDNDLFYIEVKIDNLQASTDNIQADTDQNEWKRLLKKLDMDTGATETLFDLSDFEWCGRFVVEGDHVIISGWKHFYGVFKIDLTSEEKKIESVCAVGRKTKDGAKIKDVGSFTVYNGYVYVSTDKGVIRYDVVTNEDLTLCEKNAKRCFIVDDKWVYFNDDQSTLYRVTLYGKETEKVFG